MTERDDPGAMGARSRAGRVCIGIAGADDADALHATLDALARHTDPAVEVRSLGDAVGGRAFTDLVTGTAADVVVLLEAGALVGPRWLDLLLAALSRPSCGLAGPSTDRAWNEQAVGASTGTDLPAVRRDAARMLQRFGAAVRSLAPLHSLGDFCFAVRREVVDVVGLPDPAYGEGPCWEMDYSVRAARAGFGGVWVGGAWVQRPPLSQRREHLERELLDRNRRLYQNRFCGRRLRGGRDEYREHCRGDACPNFAPRGLVQIALPFPRLVPAPRAAPGPDLTAAAAPSSTPSSTSATPARPPLVSCIMPTRGRPGLALRAARYFLDQDLTDTELVVVEDGVPHLAPLLPADPRIRLVSSRLTRSIGEMRNHACSLARGEVVVEWDDDDWHGPQRLTHQVTPLLEGRADLTGLNDLTWLEARSGRAWRLTQRLQHRMLAHDVYGGTLAFRRRVWADLARFPARSLAEDAAFLDGAIRRGARLHALSGRDVYVYVRHGGNTWQVPCGQFLDSAGWAAVEVPPMTPEAFAFYRSLRTAPLSGTSSPGVASVAATGRGTTPNPVAQPLVSCVMPTGGRRAFVGQAVAYFLRQDYPAKELVVLDDGLEAARDLVPDHPQIRYERLERRVVLGAKRNQACELATGDVIAHWDDDDWQSPRRLSIQVGRLLESGADVCGMRRLLFYDPARGRAWRYSWPPQRRRWAAGTTLVFRRDLWRRSPFPEVAQGEDTRFLWRPGVRSVVDVSDSECVVALVHSGNSVAKTGRGSYWSQEPVSEVEQLLGADVDFYRSAAPAFGARASPSLA